jgi:hypothetical protein
MMQDAAGYTMKAPRMLGTVVWIACVGITASATLADATIVKPADTPVRASGIAPQALDVASFDRERIFRRADRALGMAPVAVTQFRARLSEGGLHDFYSNGDYW